MWRFYFFGQTDLRGCAQSLSRLERSPGTRRLFFDITVFLCCHLQQSYHSIWYMYCIHLVYQFPLASGAHTSRCYFGHNWPCSSRSLRRQSNASAYTECSALTGVGVKDVFDEAVLAALLPRHGHDHHHIALVSKCSIIKVFWDIPLSFQAPGCWKTFAASKGQLSNKVSLKKIIFFNNQGCEQVQSSVRSLRRSSRGLGRSLNRQRSRSISSIR